MSRKTFAISIVVCLLLGLLLGYGIAGSEAPALRAEATSLREQVTTLQGWLDSNRTRVTALEAQVAALQASYADLSQRSNVTALGVYFSPRGGAADQVIDWVGRANETVHVLIYSFTNDDIGDAIVTAHRRGVEIRVVFEKSQVSRYSEYWKLRSAGVRVRNDTNPYLMHHKIAVIDGYIILAGSFNWSAAAEERNNENLMVLKSRYLATILEEEFERIWNTGR